MATQQESTMKRFIRLADIPHVPTPPHSEFPADVQARGRAALVARNLRYDNKRHRLYDNLHGGLCEKYARIEDERNHKPHESLEDVMRWEFSRYINNSASRILRGYTP
jgi:hypothetical protein